MSLFRTLLSSLLLASLLVGCGRQNSSASAGAADLDAIVAACQNAIKDGQYATHLSPMLHPELSEATIARSNLQNREAPPYDAREISHELRTIDSTEFVLLANFFDFSITPTHALQFSETITLEDGSSRTKATPLYLTQQDDGYFVVVGTMKSAEERESVRKGERISFTQDEGLWRHHWNMQLEHAAPYDYGLRVRDTAAGGASAVILHPSQITFHPEQKVMRFHLWSRDATTVATPAANGEILIPFAYQAGAKSASDNIRLPIDTVTQYRPNQNPGFSGNRMVLASFSGLAGKTPKVFAIELVRIDREVSTEPLEKTE